MSSVHLGSFPAIDRHGADITSWGEVDISKLNSREKKYYSKRKSAVHDYFTSQQHINEIANRHHMSPKTLKKLLKRCLMRHEDGMLWGYRALLPGVTVIDHTPASIPEVTTDETPAEEDGPESTNAAEHTTDPHLDIAQSLSAISSSPATSSDQEDTSLESEDSVALFLASTDDPNGHYNEAKGDEIKDNNDEDTAEHEAVKMSLASAKSPVTPIPSTLLDEDKLPAEEIPAEIEINDVPAEDEPGEDAGTSPAIDLDQEQPGEAREEDFNDSSIEEPIENVPAVEAQSAAPVEEESGENIEAQSVPSAEDETGEDVGATFEVAPDENAAAQPVALDGNAVGLDQNSVQPVAQYRALIEHMPPLAPALPYRPTSLYRAPAHKVVYANRMVRKHWVRSVQNQRKRRRAYRIISAAVVVAMLSVILIPVGSGLAAYSAYTHIRGVTLDGVNNLLAVKNLIPVSKSDPTAALNADKLHQAQNDLNQAESDFIQLQQLVNRPDIASAIQQFAPEYSDKLGMARNLVQVGLDVSRMGNELIGVALLGAGILHGSPLSSGSNKPLLTAADVSNAEGAMVHAQYYINDIQTQMSQVSINDLPISAKQKTELASVLTLLPKAQSLITQVQGVTGIVSWLLGIGHQRRFLVQTLDNAELRPSGGFTGQYGILQIQNGRMAPFSLQDVTELDYAGNGSELNRPAPPQYRSWMTFGFWGLRDANLSGDYPTSARLAMQVFQEEGGGPVDGDISFTPALISHVLDVTGPIWVSQYHETITAKNLEDKLHYYQQNQQAIQIQRQKTGTNNAATRKAFTSLLGKILLDKVRHLSIKQLTSLMQMAVKDIQSHDLEIYFSDPQAEAWLVAHGYADGMDTFTKRDGFMVVQSNISISKASQYVHTTEQDKVTLDAQGGATHNLTITLDYKQTGPVYGYDTYADYIRVYAPPNAQLLSGDGFDTGKPLCSPVGTAGPGPGKGTGGGPVGCSQYNTMYPSNARYCPNGNYSLGQNAYVPGKGFTFWPIDGLGAPTELTSDMPGRAMWGGLTVTPKNCVSYISLSWYVPHVVRHIAGQSPYALLVQKQGGYIPTVQLTIDTSAIKGLKPFNFNGKLIADRVFSLPALKKK